MGRNRRFWPLKIDFLRQYGNFDGGVPSHDTLTRVMALINAEQLQTAFAELMKACHDVTDGAVVAIDGKTMRGSYCRGKGKGAIHMVSAFSAANGVVLGQVKTAEKSNEITAIPELLNFLNLQGCLVTIDPMGCQKCGVPYDHMSYRSYPLLAARELLQQCIREQVYGHQTA